MANIGNLLKLEIVRLARKVVKQHVSSIQSASAGNRRQIAALKRQVADLERAVAALNRRPPLKASSAQVKEGRQKARFQAKGLRSLRARLDLSANDFGKLVGVTGQSIYSWESGKSVPRQSQVDAIAQLRKIGKKEATTRLND